MKAIDESNLKEIAENPKWAISFRDFLRAAMDGTLNEEYTKRAENETH